MADGLRERKKRRTRRALADAALRLFAERGYEQTTVADIAAAAEVSTRTFFAYFPTREDVVFADTDERIAVMRETLTALPGGTPPVRAVHRMVEQVFATDGGMFGPARATRTALVLTRPELRAKALERLLTAQQIFTDWLRTAYPKLDAVAAATVSGALMGGLVGAALASLDRGDPPERIRAELEHAVTLIARGLIAIDE
ncbi:TetR family transcriptional regulator [Plantactinospora sp. KLBMP9567]|uniref:TetR family transcriptional regulator n=1 Tax=Plantactinospora sp. KLBMP9567 TaxID=3085900 RepID=UPI00298203ED|nr:TetR family transcriptional regulator [Plantactinospora sp. KLBMP9567]MDW5327110.1 TetR family transcriptional regulator [Plantactinospora sp. KLBMP9567]